MDFNPEILQRFFSGSYSRNDYKKIKSVFHDKEKHEILGQYLRKHWMEFQDGDLSQGNVDHLLLKIHNQIQGDERRERNVRFLTIFQRIAAILILPLILSFFAIFYFQNKQQDEISFAEIQCPLGVRTKFELPDGTTGFLNSGSTLKYPVRFSGDRNVDVTGEAFFDVARDKKNPFTVHTPNMGVRVHGTQFNVVAYADIPSEEVVLKEGSVEILSGNGKRLTFLKPNQKLILDSKKMSFKTEEAEAAQYASWIEGKLVFRNEKMRVVATRLSRWYNVEIEIEDAELLQYAFRATFTDEPLTEVLKLLALTAPFTFEELKRETNKNNAYKKRKIIVRLDEKRQSAF